MIRPSALAMAENCGLAPVLAEQYPTTSSYAERGADIHTEIRDGVPKSAEARAALAWLDGKKVIGKEIKVSLVDPESCAPITEGTLDVAIDTGPQSVEIVDWKTGRPENVEPPETNLQLHAYGLGLSAELGRERYSVVLAFLDGSNIHVIRGQEVGPSEQWAMLERIRKAASRKPEAIPGPHCHSCYQRFVCPSYRERTALALTLLEGKHDLTLTDDQATMLAMRAQQVRDACDLADDVVKAHVRNGGRVSSQGKAYGPQTVQGRKSADVKSLEAAGLHQYVKQGQPYERWTWRKS